MQTFLPSVDFEECAKILDRQRLNKQRIEANQILNALQPESTSRWRNHPAVKMWRGYETALIVYRNIMIKEWMSKGYKNTMELIEIKEKYYEVPKWLGNKELHSSHRAALLKKDYDYYSQFGWEEEPKIKYYWPVR